MFAKLVSFLLSIVMFLAPWANIPKTKANTDEWNTSYTNVFVHGLGGWGSYSPIYRIFPYWGVLGGDLMTYLNARGFDCAAASVDPTASAWDRACELYAQLAGTRVDYGKEHSERCHHERYGADYSRCPLIDAFDSEHKINLFGHSFGGATILMLLDILSDGSDAEKACTPAEELSPFFEGGKGDYIYSITALAAPLNGTTATEVGDVVRADDNSTPAENAVVEMMTGLAFNVYDGRVPEDKAGYDMKIDVAAEMLKGFETNPDVYYFSIPCCATQTVDGITTPKGEMIEDVYEPAAVRMCGFTGYTEKGYYMDESWQPNDGLVNTISARAPFNAPQKDIDFDSIEKGIWNVYPTYEGDHMSLMGDLFLTNNIREMYVDMLNLINSQ